MLFEITSLGASDFEEAIDFINMVFSMDHAPHNFTELLPVYYQPTEKHMNCHYVIKRDGKIRALVGNYSGEMLAGDTKLKVARIGAVSSHPKYRKEGMMKELLNHWDTVIRNEEYDIGCLGGLRHRYMRIGYEKCGYKLIFHVNKHDVKEKSVFHESDNIEVKPVISDDRALIKCYKELHDRQKVHFIRDIDDFFNICLSWSNKLHGIYQQGRPAGYLVASGDGGRITEIIAENPDIAVKAIFQYMKNVDNWGVTICISPIDLELCRKLGQVCEVPQIESLENWCIYNWERVISAFMKVKNSVTPLQEGKLSLGIKGYGSLLISVRDGAVDCRKSNDAATLTVEPEVAARLLFGPLPPDMVVDLQGELSLLSKWCPLPLYISIQDFA